MRKTNTGQRTTKSTTKNTTVQWVRRVLLSGACFAFAVLGLGGQEAEAQVLVKEKMSVGFRGGGLFGATELNDQSLGRHID